MLTEGELINEGVKSKKNAHETAIRDFKNYLQASASYWLAMQNWESLVGPRGINIFITMSDMGQQTSFWYLSHMCRYFL